MTPCNCRRLELSASFDSVSFNIAKLADIAEIRLCSINDRYAVSAAIIATTADESEIQSDTVIVLSFTF